MNEFPQGQLLRLPKVIQRTGLGRSTIYQMMSVGLFPAPVRLSKRAVAWPDAVIAKWIETRPQTR
jgi:prophage regulatory protein